MINYTDFTFCPRCGEREIVTVNEKSLKCLQCDLVYFHNTACAVGALIIKDEKILLTVRAYNPFAGSLDVPGGFVDYDETLEEALKREIKEELGVEIQIEKYYRSLPNKYHYRNIDYFTTDAFFICHLKSNKLAPADDVADFLWKPLAEIELNKVKLKSIKKVLSELKKEFNEKNEQS